MASFPTLSIAPSLASAETTADDLQVDRATNGTPRVRALYSAPKKSFSVVFDGASAADKATLAAFYLANRLLAITFVWAADAQSYTCYFAAPVQYKRLPGARWQITVSLVQA